MARTTTHGLFVWDLTTDPFDHSQLAANWDLVETLFSRSPQNVRVVSNLTVGDPNGPRSPLTPGDIVMTSTTINSWRPYTLLRWDSATWRPVAGVEIQPAVPTLDNFIGRVVLLTANDGTYSFSTGDMIRNVDGGTTVGTSWQLVGPLVKINTGGGALNIQGLQTTGDMYYSTATRGPILVDRTTSTKYRLYINNGELYSEVVT